MDITRVEKLSNYFIKLKGKKQNVLVKQLSCGKKHCIALLNIGYVIEWGDNEYGQMGNKKRSTLYTPQIVD
jgi:alpha-tubulin suppressor-like RCC1 family protein